MFYHYYDYENLYKFMFFFFKWIREYDYTRKANEKIDVYNLEVGLLELPTKRTQ